MIKNSNWICSPANMGEVCPIFSKDIKIKKAIKKAQLRVSATGVYEAEINGKRVGDFILAPGLTSYRTRLQY